MTEHRSLPGLKFRSRRSAGPVEALRWEPTKQRFAAIVDLYDGCETVAFWRDPNLDVEVEEGRRDVHPGEWPVKRAPDDFFILADDQFKRRFEPV
jgi:hypothetical protein